MPERTKTSAHSEQGLANSWHFWQAAEGLALIERTESGRNDKDGLVKGRMTLKRMVSAGGLVARQDNSLIRIHTLLR